MTCQCLKLPVFFKRACELPSKQYFNMITRRQKILNMVNPKHMKQKEEERESFVGNYGPNNITNYEEVQFVTSTEFYLKQD